MDGDLLRPTIAKDSPARSLYGTRGFYLCSFFGGPVAALIYGGANAWRLGRLQRDLLPLVLMLLAYPALIVVLQRYGLLQAGAHQLDQSIGTFSRLVIRLLGMAYFGFAYLLHRAEHRAARVSGVQALSGTVLGFSAFAIGSAANVALGFALNKL